MSFAVMDESKLHLVGGGRRSGGVGVSHCAVALKRLFGSDESFLYTISVVVSCDQDTMLRSLWLRFGLAAWVFR